jgi:hypothetical protein
MKKYNILQKNPKTSYKGTHYAITGNGGFQINTHSEITVQPLIQFGKYDLTNSVQLVVNKKIFNSRLGIFDEISNCFSENTISLEISDLQIDIASIISLGAMETIYIDFKKYVYEYFKMSHAIHIFNEQNIDIFDEVEFYKIICENHIDGKIYIENINNILSSLVERNICGNRDSAIIGDGFIDGDLFFIPNGLVILLEVDCGIEKIYYYDISLRLE